MYNYYRQECYLNGNYFVFYGYNEKIYKRCLRVDEDLVADFPDSIDLKITNKCSHNCPFCYENSIYNGDSFNFDNTINILQQLPRVPIEIAIGGGNVLDIPQETHKLINWCNNYGFKTRITINQKDIQKFNIDDKLKLNEEQKILKQIGDDIGGVGISLVPELFSEEDELCYNRKFRNVLRGKRTIFHIIAGIFPVNKLKTLLNKRILQNINGLLVLGYKQFGRARNTELPDSLPEFESVIKEFITNSRNDYLYNFNLAFDNLALEQLHMKEFITEDAWDRLYLGKEGSCSMYIDAVNETYARSSTSVNRVNWKDIGLLEFFKSLRNENNN